MRFSGNGNIMGSGTGAGIGHFPPSTVRDIPWWQERREVRATQIPPGSHRMHKHPLFQFYWLRWMTCICHSGSIFSHAFSFSDSQSCTTNPYQFYTLESHIYITYIFMSAHRHVLKIPRANIPDCLLQVAQWLSFWFSEKHTAGEWGKKKKTCSQGFMFI